MDWKEVIETRKRDLRGQIQALTPTAMAVLTFIVLLAIAGIMLGKLASVNTLSLGNNTNATNAINIGFDQIRLTQDIGTLIVTVVLLLFALGAFFMLMGGGGKKGRRGQIQALTPTAMAVLTFIVMVVIATIMLGKLAAVNTASLGANANATNIINIGFDQMKLTQDIGTLVITIVLLLFALGAFFTLMGGGGGGKKRR